MNSIREYNLFILYTQVIVLVIGVMATFAALFQNLKNQRNDTLFLSFIILLILVWRIGGLPLPEIWSDRDAYAASFMGTQFGDDQIVAGKSDKVLGIINKILYPFCSVDSYFYVMAFIYGGLYLLSCRRLVGNHVIWLFLGCILSFGFIRYGTNTMRAGLACSFLMMGFSYNQSLVKMGCFFALATLTHYSMIIPVSMFMVSKYYDKTKLFFYLWILSIPLSFVAGGFFQNLFSTLSADDRVGYLNRDNDGYKIGFRIDFILYSMAPLIVGYYYIFKKKYKSLFYRNLYNAYILTNIFWILVIKANYSDRFAYLSWFMIPLVLIYPLLDKPSIVKNPAVWLSAIFMGDTLFKLII